MNETIEWYKVENSKVKRQIRLSDRTAGFIRETGEVLLSANVFGGEMRNAVCMGFDGIPFRILDGRLYCPATWLKKEFPSMADDIEAISRKIVEYAKQ